MLGGCAQYTAVQMTLVQHARKGALLTQQSLAEKSRLIEQFQKRARARLDDAFDADVREQSELSADWVIDHRRAYSAAMDAMNEQLQATRAAQVADEKNLASIDDALQRVLWLQSIELRFANLPQEIKP